MVPKEAVVLGGQKRLDQSLGDLFVAHGDAALLTENTATSRPGAAIQIVASVTGTVTLVLWSGNSIVVTVPVGVTVLPYEVIKATEGSATVTSYYNLFQ